MFGFVGGGSRGFEVSGEVGWRGGERLESCEGWGVTEEFYTCGEEGVGDGWPDCVQEGFVDEKCLCSITCGGIISLKRSFIHLF